MHNPASAEEKAASGHTSHTANGRLVANGDLPPGMHPASVTHTVAEVHPDPSRSLNSGRTPAEIDSEEEEKEDAPLLRRKKSGRNW